MKKFLMAVLAMALMFSLVGCGSNSGQQEEVSDQTPSGSQVQTEASSEEDMEDVADSSAGEMGSNPDEAESDADETEGSASDGSNILIAYFSKTGNTETIANMIAEQTGGELFKVETVTPYPDDYNETVDIAREEQDNDARPELSTHVEDMSQYDVIYLGYPNWWGTMPQAMFTFLEEYDFSGKTIIPFCTHGGSALGRSEGDIADLVPDATLLEGLAVSGSRVDSAQGTVEEWLNSLEIAE